MAEGSFKTFGLDYGDRLRSAGFKEVTESDFINTLRESDMIKRYALQKDEIIYFCEKI